MCNEIDMNNVRDEGLIAMAMKRAFECGELIFSVTVMDRAAFYSSKFRCVRFTLSLIRS